MIILQRIPLPFLLIFSLIAGCIEVDMAVPSFPEIAAFFNVSEGLVQQTITYNFLGFFIGGLIYGPLSDSLGRRKTMLLGSVIMLIGALGCTLANSIETLLISRFIQGLGAGTPVVVVYAIIADRYQGLECFKIIGWVNAAISSLMALAPLFGGLVNAYLGWRGNYAVVVIITLLSLIMLTLALPETKTERTSLRVKQTLCDYFKLGGSYAFLRVSLIPSLLFAAYMVFVASSAFLYMKTYHLPVTNFVLHFFLVVASFAVPSLFASKITALIGSEEKAVVIGSATAILALGLLFFVNNAWALTLLMCIFCVGFAICYPIIFGRSLNVFPNMQGAASSLTMSLRSLLVSVSIGFVSTSFTGQLSQITTIVFSLAMLSLILLLLRPIETRQKSKKW